jgi:hypothetical protein
LGARPGEQNLNPQATVTNKPDRRGEHEVSRKPLRAGTPGDSGWTCSDYTRVLSTLHTRLRVQQAPGVPHALCFPGELLQRLGRIAPRDREAVTATRLFEK